jgi:hypothetical protein
VRQNVMKISLLAGTLLYQITNCQECSSDNPWFPLQHFGWSANSGCLEPMSAVNWDLLNIRSAELLAGANGRPLIMTSGLKYRAYAFRNDRPPNTHPMPMVSGGITQADVPDIIRELGTDILIGSGGGVHGHPQGLEGGARAFRKAIDATMKGIPIEEAAKEDEALGVPLGLWGKKTDFKK